MKGTTITRAEITESLVREVGLNRTDSAAILDDVLEMIGYALETDEIVKMSRFGNFVVREKSARFGRNPKTGEEANIAARRVITFKPSPKLKSIVDSGK